MSSLLLALETLRAKNNTIIRSKNGKGILRLTIDKKLYQTEAVDGFCLSWKSASAITVDLLLEADSVYVTQYEYLYFENCHYFSGKKTVLPLCY